MPVDDVLKEEWTDWQYNSRVDMQTNKKKMSKPGLNCQLCPSTQRQLCQSSWSFSPFECLLC